MPPSRQLLSLHDHSASVIADCKEALMGKTLTGSHMHALSLRTKYPG